MIWKASIGFIILVLASCGTYRNESPDGYAHLKPLPEIRPKPTNDLSLVYRFYTPDDTSAIFYIRIDPSDLLSKRDSLDEWSRRAKLELVLRKGGVSKETVFEGEREWTFRDSMALSDSLRFRVPPNEDLLYTLVLTDLNKHSYSDKQAWWIRRERLEDACFMLLDAQGKMIIPPYAAEDTLRIRSDIFRDREFRLLLFTDLDREAPAPFAWSNLSPDFQKPDTTYIAKFDGNLLEIPLREGYALLSLPEDREAKSGFFTFDPDPRKALYRSMSYLCSERETERLKNSLSADSMFNAFWDKASRGDSVRRRRLLDEFTERVQYAEKSFSSYKPGYLTDRGMIYIVFGAPDRVQQEGFQEVWIYNQIAMDQFSFVFYADREKNAPNNFFLERNMHYKSIYYMTVENWREGLVKLPD